MSEGEGKFHSDGRDATLTPMSNGIPLIHSCIILLYVHACTSTYQKSWLIIGRIELPVEAPAGHSQFFQWFKYEVLTIGQGLAWINRQLTLSVPAQPVVQRRIVHHWREWR